MLAALKYYSIRLAIVLHKALPEFVKIIICYSLAFLSFLFLKNRRKIIEENIKIITGKENKKLVLQTFINFSLDFADLLKIYCLNSEKIKKLPKIIRGTEYIENALKNGKGIIFVDAHLGNWEVGGCFLGAMGYPVVAVVEPLKDKRYYKLLNKLRTKTGMGIIELNLSVGRNILKNLKQGKLVVLLGDRDLTGTGIEVEFFGKKARLPKGPAQFALKTGAPIITGYFVRKGLHYIVEAEPPINYIPTGDKEKDIRNLTEILAKRLENKIKEYPTQWYVFQRPWD